MKKLFILLCMLLSIGFTSFASSWYWIGADSTGNQWYVDNENVYTHWITSREMSENLYDYQHGLSPMYHTYKVVWIKINNTDGTYAKQRIKVMRNKKMELLSYVNYDSDGSVIDADTISFPEEADIIPDTMGEALYELIF